MTDSNFYLQCYKHGAGLYTAGHYNEALVSLKKALVGQPNFPDVYYLIAQIYSELELYPDSVSMFEKVIKLLPNDLEIYRAYGKTLLKSGEEKKGLKILQKSLKLNPKDEQVRIDLGRYLLQQEQYKKALSIIEAGIRIQPESVPLICLAGDVLAKLKKFEKAQSNYESCLEIDPDYEPAKRGFNIVVRAMEDDVDSIDRSHEEMAKDEMLEAANLYRNKNYDQAIDRLLELKDRPGVEREASMLLGMSYVKKGLFKRAFDVLHKFSKVHTPDIMVWYYLGLSCNRMGLYSEAFDFLDEALVIDAVFEEALVEMGISCHMMGETVLGSEYLIRALKINRDNPRPYVQIARMAFDKNDKPKVKEFLKRAQECDPACPAILAFKGYVAVHRKKYVEAIDFFQKCLEATPDHFEILKLQGRAQYELGDQEGAKESFRAASTLNPADPECQQLLSGIE
jgi:tetratricopeptide (TPR) repeat protein